MAHEVLIPRLGLTMEEGSVVEWYKQDGEQVTEGEPLYSIETDKAIQEVEAPASGILRRVPGISDEPLPVGTLIAYIAAPGEQVGASDTPVPDVGPAPDAAAPTVDPAPGALVEEPPHTPFPESLPQPPRKRASPLARRRAQQLGIDWRQIERPGGGPILFAHVEEAAKRLQPSEPSSPAPAPDSTVPVASKLTSVRRVIGERMLAGMQQTAPVTLISEVDATELVALRAHLRSAAATRGQSVPAYHDLMIKLVAAALEAHPQLNTSLNDGALIHHDAVHMGLAVDTEAGLVVPVIRDVQAKSLRHIADESQRLIEKAHARELQADDMQGGTFTITNLGMYRIDAFTPIINLPQCAILGVGRIKSQPAVYHGEVVPRDILTLSLTFDHRIVDGGPAARFLDTLGQLIEDPYPWLIL